MTTEVYPCLGRDPEAHFGKSPSQESWEKMGISFAARDQAPPLLIL